jgi:uncharacterized membrane protein YeaQ/YmgE (transglycosylase-associated protein family)
MCGSITPGRVILPHAILQQGNIDVITLTQMFIWIIIATVVGFLGELIARRRAAKGILGAILLGLLAIFLIVDIFQFSISGEPFVGGVPLLSSIIAALIGAVIPIAGLRLIRFTINSRRPVAQRPSEPQMVPQVEKKASLPQMQRVQNTPPSTHYYQPTLSLFISHSSKDDEFGRKLVKDLRQALGSDEAVWYDSEGGLYGGDSWWSRIVSVLGTCDVFVIVLSPNSINSKWVMRELDIAMVEGKRIVPVLYRQCDVRPDLRAIQIVSFLEPILYEAAFNRLLQALKH